MNHDDKIIRWKVEALLAGSTVANTVLIALALGMDVNKTRRLLDRMVKEGRLDCEQGSFWNGMHYAKRNYYWRRLPKGRSK